jgi:hypothetical protein
MSLLTIADICISLTMTVHDSRMVPQAAARCGLATEAIETLDT